MRVLSKPQRSLGTRSRNSGFSSCGFKKTSRNSRTSFFSPCCEPLIRARKVESTCPDGIKNQTFWVDPHPLGDRKSVWQIEHRMVRFCEFWKNSIGPWSDLYSVGKVIQTLVWEMAEERGVIPHRVYDLIDHLVQSDHLVRPRTAQEALDYLFQEPTPIPPMIS